MKRNRLIAFSVALWRRYARNPFAQAIFGTLAILLTIALIPKVLTGGALLATVPVATRRSLKEVLTELKGIQEKFRGKEMPAAEATQFETLCKEAEEIQKEADRDDQVKRYESLGNRVPSPTLPAGGGSGDPNITNVKNRIAGYASVGDIFAFSEQLSEWQKGKPQTSNEVPLPGLLRIKGLPGAKGGQLYVPLGRELRQKFESLIDQFESKSSPVLGSRVIEPDRLGDIVMADENQRLTLRDVMNVSQTTSNLIEWVRRDSFTSAATVVSEGASKPEAATEYSLQQSPVKTIAVWIPVSEQQLQDAPQIINLVNTDLLFDVRLVEEQQLSYGAGTGQNFTGFFVDAGIVAGRTSVGDTIIDKIRRSVTDVRVSMYEPNAIWMHPIDWESVELTKGSDLHYIWVIVTDANGSRIWGLRVVEGVGCLKPGATERNILVGDFIRGATLWDRMQATLAVGWQNDQFIKNMRTIRAEERLAFAIRRPSAFRKINTAA